MISYRNGEVNKFICDQKYPILSLPLPPSLFTGTGLGWLKGGRAYRDAIKEQCAAYFRLQTEKDLELETMALGLKNIVLRY